MSRKLRPPEGADVDETRVVTLLAVPPSSSVSVRLGDGRVFLSKRQLEEMAEDAAAISRRWAADPSGVTEEQRLRMIDGSRAGDLLEAVSHHADEAAYLADEGKLPREAGNLLSRLLEEGTVAVTSLKTGQVIPSARVHYVGLRAGPTFGRGEISISFDYGTERGFLLAVDWWVA